VKGEKIERLIFEKKKNKTQLKLSIIFFNFKKKPRKGKTLPTRLLTFSVSPHIFRSPPDIASAKRLLRVLSISQMFVRRRHQVFLAEKANHPPFRKFF
jgi:hypothetical protein